ncbi:XRE family transcriptional regulator [Arthrobacter sp. SA17]
MPSIPALVEVSVLRWARETCGLSDLAASRKIGVPDDRVALWESGQQQPTVAQFKKAAAVYKRSLSVFFLSEPPSGFDTLRDFRRLAGSEAGEWSPDLHDEYRRAHTQRDYLLELSELEDQDVPSAWRLPETPGSDEELARAGRDALLAASALELPQNAGTPYEHLNFWISALEEAGVLVAATRGGRIAVKETRAFSLHFDVLPVIVVNGADSPRGRLFSLMHEYAHLLLHTEGLCDTTTDLRATSPDRELEARCNAIAGSLLVPGNVLLSRPEVIARRDSPNTWDYETLKPVAAAFGVSAEVILRRLTTLGRVSRTFYEQQRETFLAAYEREEVQSRAGAATGTETLFGILARDM